MSNWKVCTASEGICEQIQKKIKISLPETAAHFKCVLFSLVMMLSHKESNVIFSLFPLFSFLPHSLSPKRDGVKQAEKTTTVRFPLPFWRDLSVPGGSQPHGLSPTLPHVFPLHLSGFSLELERPKQMRNRSCLLSIYPHHCNMTAFYFEATLCCCCCCLGMI